MHGCTLLNGTTNVHTGRANSFDGSCQREEQKDGGSISPREM